MRQLTKVGLITLVLLWSASGVMAAPTTTLTIDPSATAGTTITAADTNDRSSDVTTWANAHTHRDEGTLSGVNTLTIGDGLAGTKTYAIDNEFTTAPAIRYNNVREGWQILPDGSNVDFLLKDERLTVGDNTAGIKTVLAVDNEFTTSPAIRYSNTAESWQFSNDSTTFTTIGTSRFLLGNASTGDTATHYATPLSSTTATAEASIDVFESPAANGNFTLSNMHAEVQTAPAGGASWTVTLRVNLGATALSCAISGANLECDDSDSVNISSGDTITIEWLAAGGPTGSAQETVSFSGVQR